MIRSYKVLDDFDQNVIFIKLFYILSGLDQLRKKNVIRYKLQVT